jgi:hypothetical protein
MHTQFIGAKLKNIFALKRLNDIYILSKQHSLVKWRKGKSARFDS